MQDPASQSLWKWVRGVGPGWGLVCWRVAVTCWLVPAAAASCRHVTRCSRRPCSGPCTWRCTSGEGKDEPLRSGPRLVPRPRAADCARAAYSPRRLTKSAHARRPPHQVQPATPPPLVLPAPNCPGNPPASRYTSGSTCPSSSVGTREPSVATPAPTDPASPQPTTQPPASPGPVAAPARWPRRSALSPAP